MSHKTPFAGLTEPEAGESIDVDNRSFVTRNPSIIDHFLRVGALTHVHDGHPALPDPVATLGATVDTTGGTIPADRDIYVGYTLLDNYGGETLLSDVVNATTPPPLGAPATALVATYEPGAGDMVVGVFNYAITLVDGDGGETPLGPSVSIQRPPGDVNASIELVGLAAEIGVDAGAEWRLWRADNGGAFHIIATGTADIFTDDGINPTDLAASPPTSSNGTRSTNKVTVLIPDPVTEPGLAIGSATSGFRLYLSGDGAFNNPSLYGEYDVEDAATPIVITALDVVTGAPPDVSTAIPGATPIDPGPGGGGGSALLRTQVSDATDHAIKGAGQPPLEIPLTLTEEGIRQRVEVALWLEHDDLSTLIIELVQPDNQVVSVMGLGTAVLDNLGTGAEPCTLAFFADDGDVTHDYPIDQEQDPAAHVGFWRSVERMSSTLIGDDDDFVPQGEWRLRFITDTGTGTDKGVVHYAAINFEPHRMPRFVPSTAMIWRGDYSATVHYSTGNVVRDGITVYVSTVDNNVGLDPATDPGWQAI